LRFAKKWFHLPAIGRTKKKAPVLPALFSLGIRVKRLQVPA